MPSLHAMARAGDVEGMRLALSAIKSPKALVNEIDESGFTPLYYAVSASEPKIELVRALLDAGADPTFVRTQTFPEFPSDMEELLDDVPEVDRDELLGFFDRGPTEYREPLLTAALKGSSVEVVQLLCQYGADLGYRDENNYTAVLNAVYGDGDRLPMVRYLIGLGLDVRAVSSYGESPITVAYRFGRFEVVAELLKAGADESLVKWSPLHRAVALGTEADIRAELERGAGFDAFDFLEQSPLHTALRRGDAGIVESLVHHGADLRGRTQDDDGSLALAVEGGNLRIVERVLEADNSSKDMDAALGLAVEGMGRDRRHGASFRRRKGLIAGAHRSACSRRP